MPKYHVVIHNASLAHEREIHRNVEANVKVHGEWNRQRIERFVSALFTPRPAGTIHADAVETACPDGMANCRNCGDPDHAETCRAAGHCPLCGTVHGLAPDAHILANGYRLERAD